MIRVAVFIPRYFPIFGGAENQAKLLNRELIASKKVTIPFLLTHRLNKELEKKVVIDEIKVHRLGLPGMGLWSSLSFLLTSVLFLLIHHRKLDVIHSHASSVPENFLDDLDIIQVFPKNDEELAFFYRSLDILIAAGHIQLGACHYPVLEGLASGVAVIHSGYLPGTSANSS